jgi:hypothetical protein
MGYGWMLKIQSRVGGPGNIHLQIGGNKYYYNFQTGQFGGLSNRLARQIAGNAKLARALQSALHALGL